MLNTVTNIFLALWEIGLIPIVAMAIIRYFNSKTKNENIKMFLSWAKQAVAKAEVDHGSENTVNALKKIHATEFINQRLKANGLQYKFSDEQISAAIEMAVKELKNK